MFPIDTAYLAASSFARRLANNCCLSCATSDISSSSLATPGSLQSDADTVSLTIGLDDNVDDVDELDELDALDELEDDDDDDEVDEVERRRVIAGSTSVTIGGMVESCEPDSPAASISWSFCSRFFLICSKRS